MDSEFLVGVDIGSETAKAVVFTKDGVILEKIYLKHFGKAAEITHSILKDFLKRYKNLKICFTGVSGRFIAKRISAPYINEIISQATATVKFYPEVRTIIEIGGEDSKLIFLDEAGRVVDFSLNSICAAGTGSFLEQQAERLGLSLSEFSQLAVASKKPSKVAGRCSVFAKSDMIHLQQIATPTEDIIAGVCFALARNFKATMLKGRKINPVVSFQGGVAANKGMVRAFKEVLELDEILIPKHFEVMGAIGAAVKAKEEDVYLTEETINKLNEIKYEIEYGLPALKREILEETYSIQLYSDSSQYAYLGIDVGSVSTNIALIDEKGNLIAKKYLPTAGRPIEAVRKGLSEISQEFPNIKIKGVGVTGSGRYTVAHFVGADVVKNEITAHAYGALHFDKTVDTIFEIGGQDSKYIRLKDGKVIDFTMNKACAAGTGSFIEEQAEKLGLTLKEFQELAFSSKSPCRLGERCTVFMENSLVINLHKGASKEDIVAGLCYSIVENYINRVVADKPIGKRIFFQGGVAFNKAIEAAFKNFLKLKIGDNFQLTVPPHHEVMGAIGVALLAQEEINKGKTTAFKGFSVKDLSYSITSFECKGCPNYCEINKIRIENEKDVMFYGGRCEKYEKKETQTKLPDPLKIRENLLWEAHLQYEDKMKDEKKPTIGIPYIFFFHDQLPFWSSLLWELGFNVVVSDRTNKEIINEGIEKTPSEACFPLKVVYGHIINLQKKGVKLLLIPSFMNLNLNDEYERGLACPLVQTTPYIAKKVFDDLKILDPRVDLSKGADYLKQELKRVFKGIINTKNIDYAIARAKEKQDEFLKKLKKEGLKFLETVNDKTLGQTETVVLVGRAYNTFDPALNLNISHKLRSLGVLPITMDMLPIETVSIKNDWINLYWRSGQRIVRAARLIKKMGNLYPIFITNFACGPDSFIINYFKEECEPFYPYLIIEIDEHSADAGVLTRIEAYIDSLKERKKQQFYSIPVFLKSFLPSDISKRVIYIPRMADHAFALKAAFQYCGIEAEVMPPSDKESIEVGKKYILGGECFPYLVTLGDMLKIVFSKDFYPEKTAFFMPSGAGPCRFGQYNVSHRMVLKKLGLEHVPVYSPQQDAQFYRDLNIAGGQFSLRAWQGVVSYGLLTKSLLECRPYEKNKGETEALYNYYLEKIYETLKAKDGRIEEVLRKMKRDFEAIPKYREQKPLVGIVGEIFVRCHTFSNEDLIRKLESFGLEVYLTPIEEWIHYVNTIALRKALIKRDKSAIMKILINKFFQGRVEKKFTSIFKDFLKFSEEPSTKDLFKMASAYVPDSFEGETILSVAKTIDLIKRGVKGIVNTMPFGCMPGAIVTSFLRFIQKEYNIPAISIIYDGTASTGNELKIEAFVEAIKLRKGGD
ncbi:MAG: acyl-CoA dehydratase activase [Thermodesulfovibrio sp.]|nr:acyl-CoA dehydratase activase [Thermodesulfovibrio sp.]